MDLFLYVQCFVQNKNLMIFPARKAVDREVVWGDGGELLTRGWDGG